MEPVSFLLLLMLGVWAALDTTSVGQFMVSRPLISGTLAGWILGDPASGLLLGGLLEGIHLADLPAGGTRLPEPGPAAVPAVAAFIGLGGGGGLALGVGLGVALALVGGLSMEGQRALNARMGVAERSDELPPFSLSHRHLPCVALDALRGMILTLLGLLLAGALPDAWAARWPLDPYRTAAFLALPGVLAGGALLRSWNARGAETLTLFMVGVGSGLLLGWMG